MRTFIVLLMVFGCSLFACSESLNHLGSKVVHKDPKEGPLTVMSGHDFCALGPHNFEDGVEQRAFTRMRLSDVIGAEGGQIGWLLGPSKQETPMIAASAIVWEVSSPDPTMRSLISTRIDVYAGDVEAKLHLSLPANVQTASDAGSLETFFDNAFSISLRFQNGQELTGLPEGWTVSYAPCIKNSIRDEFVFEFHDGDILTAEIVTVSGANGNGYYAGFFVSLSGDWRDGILDLSEFDRLYMHGSTKSWAERSIPTLSVRWSASAESEVCGIVFNTRQWYASDAIKGYRVQDLRCDGRLGSIRPLVEVSYPDHYVLP